MGLFRIAHEFVFGAVNSGYAVALAGVCLLQYLAHLHRVGRMRRDVTAARQAHETAERELQDLASELEDLARDRSLTRFEAQVLREFLAQESCDLALRGLLHRLVPDCTRGFAVFLCLENGRFKVCESHGMLQCPAAPLDLGRELLTRLTAGNPVLLKRQGTLEQRLWSWFSPRDRNRIESLHLFGIASSGELLGILLATELAPAGAEPARRIEMTARLMSSIFSRMREKLRIELREGRLRSSEDMLALRAIADRRYSSPLRMFEEFLRQAAERLAAEQGALFLCPLEAAAPVKALVRAGTALQAGVRETLLRHEQMLAVASLSLRGPQQYLAEELERLGISTLVGSALVVPVIQEHRLLALTVFSRRRGAAFSESQTALAGWSGALLADLLPRVVTQAAVERKARLDGLTQLANRSEFDRRIEEDLELAKTSRGCLSLLLFDLDHFKAVNDTYGHRAGDAVLRATAATLLDCVQGIRAADRKTGVRPFVARYGGEELAVLVGLELPGARRIGELVRERLAAQPVEFEGATIRVTASAGLAGFPEHADSAAQLVEAADAALYHAKANGRNRIEVASLALADA